MRGNCLQQNDRWAGIFKLLVIGTVLVPLCTAAQVTAAGPASLSTQGLPDTGLSLLRVFGALVLVLGLFLGAVWVWRNARGLTGRGGRIERLHVLEVRSLGGKHALYVVGYDEERLLLAASPTGVNLLSRLPPAPVGEAASAHEPASSQPLSFPQVLAQVLKAG